MMGGEEEFYAWLDGELPAADAAEMEAAVANDPELQRLAEKHRALGARLKAAFDPVMSVPVPERLAAMVQPRADVGNFTARQKRPVAWLPQWAAMAAVLAAGILVGTFLPRGSSGPAVAEAGKLYAAAALDDALDTQLASAPTGSIRVVMTFRNQAGAICRSFNAPAASGLACRKGSRWELKGLFGAPEGQGSDYRMAAGMDPNLATLVSSTVTGAPFDAKEERAAKAQGWR